MSVIELRPREDGDPRLPAGLTVAEELAIAWSWAGTWQRRYSHVRVRQMRLVIAGALIGGALAWLLDGSLSQRIDQVLRAVGL